MMRKRSWWGWCGLSSGLSSRLLGCRWGGRKSSRSADFGLCRGCLWLCGDSSSVGEICGVSRFGCGSSCLLLLLRLVWLNRLNRLGRLRGGSSSSRATTGNTSFWSDFLALVWKEDALVRGIAILADWGFRTDG
jgi:hypothetical protein